MKDYGSYSQFMSWYWFERIWRKERLLSSVHIQESDGKVLSPSDFLLIDTNCTAICDVAPNFVRIVKVEKHSAES